MAVDLAISYLQLKATEKALPALVWSPGLFHAARDFGADIVNE